MQFNPATQELYTDAGERIKTLHCPRKMRWSQLDAVNGHATQRFCQACDHMVLETAALSDEALLAAVQADPSACLYLRPDQPNLTLIAHSPGHRP